MKTIIFLLIAIQFHCANVTYCENYLNNKVKGSSGILHWQSNNIHYRVHVDGAGDNGLNYSATSALIQAAYDVWAGVPTTNVTFTPDGSITGAPMVDGINGHYWIYPPHALFGGPFYDDPNTPEIEGASAYTIWQFENNVIVETDIMYNGLKEWKGTDHLTWWNEVESAAIHEIGHTLGFADAAAGMSPIPVMTYSAAPSSDRRTLKDDDKKAVSFLYGGNLIENETFSGTNYFDWNITVRPGKTLTFQAGSTINFAAYTSLIINGTLSAQGTSSNSITFTPFTWEGIRFNSGSSGNLQYCNIGYATYGIYCNGYLPNIEHCNFTYNTYGIYAQNVGATNNTIGYSTISNNTSAGIHLYNSSPKINYSTIENNGTAVYCDYYSSPQITYTTMRTNTSQGLRCNSYSSPSLLSYGYPGYNVIRNNGGYGVYASYNSNPALGNSSYGLNSIYSNSSCEVRADYNCTIPAQNNWWGTSPPVQYEFCPTQSTITYMPALDYDPNPGRSIIPINDNNNVKQSGISYSVLSDYFSQAEQKYNEGNYNEAIDLYLEAFKQEKDNSIGRLALIKIEECFTKAGRKDYLVYSNQKTRPLMKDGSELYVVALELEAHQMLNAGMYKDVVDNLLTILKKYNLNNYIEKNTLFRLGAFYSQFLGDVKSSDKYFDELKQKYPDDELVNQIETIKSLGVVSSGLAYGAQLIQTEEMVVSRVDNNVALANYPNPFNPTTKISFSLPQKSQVKLKVFDVLGREIQILTDGNYEAGKYEVEFNATNLPSGVYFFNLTTGSNSITKKMLLIK